MVPKTTIGMFLAAAMMILGYSTICMCSISVVSATDSVSATPNADSQFTPNSAHMARKRSATLGGPIAPRSVPSSSL
jgi:hypothetical protein